MLKFLRCKPIRFQCIKWRAPDGFGIIFRANAH